MAKDLTLLIPTLNRAETLRKTLNALTRVRRADLALEIVVIDNGSRDHTHEVLRSFRSRLPLTTLREGITGKPHALNHALERVSLGDIVVFTDDDITPDVHWIEGIVETCRRWPNHSVFGGPIEPEWPQGFEPPAWARQDLVQVLAFARHDYGELDREYPLDIDPFGGNFWVRREALLGVRFDEKIGAHAHPGRQRLGDETQFLQQLRRRGLVPLYTARARVKHRVAPDRASKWAVYRRALQGGLGSVYVKGLPSKRLFRRSPKQWRLNCLKFIGRLIRRFPGEVLASDEAERVLKTISFLWSVAESTQALRLSLTADAGLMDWISQYSEHEAQPHAKEGERSEAAAYSKAANVLSAGPG